MSVVIAVRYKDGVIMAADKQITWGNLKTSNATKLIQTKWSNIGIGGVGSGRLCDLLEIIDEIIPASDILKQIPIDRKYMIKYLVPDLFKHFKEYNMVLSNSNNENYIDGNLMICTPYLIHSMGNDGSLVQYENYASIGCGEQLVHGYLSTLSIDWSKLKEEKAIEILIDCIHNACKDDVYIDDNIDIVLLRK